MNSEPHASATGSADSGSPADPRAAVLDRWHARARGLDAHIVLADSDKRAVEAAGVLESNGLARVTVLADVEPHLTAEIRGLAMQLGEGVDPSDPLHVAALMVRSGQADAAVGGATRPTPDVIRAGLRILGVAPDMKTVSSSFLMALADGQLLCYGDCGVVPDPDADQLADIALATAATFGGLTGTTPRIAMLSFSTHGSADHPSVDKVRAATALVRSRAPEAIVDGELQFDAAWVPTIAAAKAPGSAVAGQANVFVFPDLNAGNIGYKITERLGHALAFGPLLQGLDGVLHDLSRGCSVDDIVNVAVIAALQTAT